MSWKHEEDPNGVVPNLWVGPNNTYKVKGFCSPAGKDILFLMVQIEYPDSSGDFRLPFEQYTVTANYIGVLKDYLAVCTIGDLNSIRNEYLQNKLKKEE